MSELSRVVSRWNNTYPEFLKNPRFSPENKLASQSLKLNKTVETLSTC